MYRGTRRDVSLLLEAGHPAARRYSLATVWIEADIVRQRQAGRRKLEAATTQLAVASILSKEAGKAFSNFVASLERCD